MFKDRREAGRFLAGMLKHYRDREDTLILALPRGGVPVAYETAVELHLPLDVFLVRKLGVPGHEELAMGAIATGGVRILNDDIVSYLNVSPEEIEAATARETEELMRREALYRDGRPPPEVRNRTVIVVDDGLATGATMRAAVAALRQSHPARIVVAIPVAAYRTCEELRQVADEVVCVDTPEHFYAVGQGYERFDQTTDVEVRNLLQRVA
jgi:predicted phosphoribosyltransferase